MKYYRTDVVTAAQKTFGKKPMLANGERSMGIALQEVDDVFTIRTVGGHMNEFRSPDGVRHLYERDVRTLAGPFGSLAEVAKHFGVKPRQ